MNAYHCGNLLIFGQASYLAYCNIRKASRCVGKIEQEGGLTYAIEGENIFIVSSFKVILEDGAKTCHFFLGEKGFFLQIFSIFLVGREMEFICNVGANVKSVRVE